METSSRKRAKIHPNTQPKGVFKERKEEDAEDEFDEELEPAKRRAGGFKTDVYESDEEVDGPDSDEDTEDEREDIKPHVKKDENDDDMFGDEEAASAPKKKAQFLKSHDIEGQEWQDNQDGEGDENAPVLESFNMDQELAEGDFTEAGVYIRKKDEQSFHDSWLKGIGKSEIQKASEAHQKMLQREADQEKLDFEAKKLSPDQYLLEIYKLLQPGETITGAIKRLGTSSSKVPKWKKPKKNAKSNAQEISPEQMEINKKQLDILSSYATILFETNADIYEMSFREISLHLQSVKLIDL